MTYHCAACGASISQRHLRQHLSRSQNPLCKAYLAAELDGVLEAHSVEDHSSDPAGSSAPAPPSTDAHNTEDEADNDFAVSSSGDIFGDFHDLRPADFSADDDTNFVAPTAFADHDTDREHGSSTDDDEEDPSSIDSELELPIDRGPAPETGVLSDEEDEDDNGDYQIPADNDTLAGASGQREPSPMQDRDIAEERLRQRPHIVPYGNQAGAPLAARPGETTEQQEYRTTMGNTTNIYAPFGSRMEWEIARWAKLSGPSATAFSELIKIDGVRSFLPTSLLSLHL